MSDIAHLARAAAERGQRLQKEILALVQGHQSERQLPDFNIERAASLIGVSTSTLRAYERQEKIPKARVVPAGSVDRRVYNYNEINHIRKILGIQCQKPLNIKQTLLVFSNLKGGVAKTTMSIHATHYLARAGYRVLLVDADPQASATATFGLSPDTDLGTSVNIATPMLDDPDRINEVILKTHWDNLDLLPASIALQGIDWRLANEPMERREAHPITLRMKEALMRIDDSHNYDVIVIDTPPSMGILGINAIAAANILVIPVEPQMYAINSAIQHLVLIQDVLNRYAQHVDVHKLCMLLTKIDTSSETRAMVRLLMRAYGGLLLSQQMPMTAELARAGTDHISLYEIERPRGSRDTFQRALERMDAVNAEITQILRGLWDTQAAAQLPTKPPEAQDYPIIP